MLPYVIIGFPRFVFHQTTKFVSSYVSNLNAATKFVFPYVFVIPVATKFALSYAFTKFPRGRSERGKL